MIPNNQPKATQRRILCIDGGGIVGTFPAAFLAGIERQLPAPIGSYFDLIAGTSTGGIIAIALAMGLRASDLVDLYEQRGPAIFGAGRGAIRDLLTRVVRTLRQVALPKHDERPLRSALEAVFQDRRLGDARTRLLVPAWNPVARTVYVYKTAHHPRLSTDYLSTAVDAAMATAAAPTYFRRHITRDAVGLTDGGTWANNPVGLAVVEAVALLGWPASSLEVLSLGCVQETYLVPGRAGIGPVGTNLVRLFMDGQSHGSMGIAKLLTGDDHERKAIHRVTHTAPANSYSLDDTRAISDLKGLGYSAARERLPVLQPIFFQRPADAFEPCYPPGTQTPSSST